jgi:hypothetical protein
MKRARLTDFAFAIGCRAWELATAVRYTSAIEDRLFISDLLGQLGDGIRDVRDEVVSLQFQMRAS